jgi:hypothetical protein
MLKYVETNRNYRLKYVETIRIDTGPGPGPGPRGRRLSESYPSPMATHYQNYGTQSLAGGCCSSAVNREKSPFQVWPDSGGGAGLAGRGVSACGGRGQGPVRVRLQRHPVQVQGPHPGLQRVRRAEATRMSLLRLGDRLSPAIPTPPTHRRSPPTAPPCCSAPARTRPSPRPAGACSAASGPPGPGPTPAPRSARRESADC